MKISAKIHRQLTIQNGIFYLLLVIVMGLLAQLSLTTDRHYDWTANNRHSLAEPTKILLDQLTDTVTIHAFISPSSEYRPALESLLNRYLRYSNNIKVNYINPDFSPDRVREFQIQQQAEMVVSFADRQQHVHDLSEQSLTNAIISVSREQDQWLLFIEGHGERSPFGQANYDLALWGKQLSQKGFKLQSLNLIEQPQIPDNTAALIIASPEKAWLAGEMQLIRDYLDHGGNLLWLTEPNNNQYLASLAEYLGIEFVAGTVFDPNTTALGIADPRFALITQYAHHPVGVATTGVTLLPQAVAIELNQVTTDWQAIPLLTTADNSWSETSAIEADKINSARFDLGADTAGPLNLAYLLSRPFEHSDDTINEQRIAIIGDGDLLSNSYLGNGANSELGMALMNWLVNDDSLITLPLKTTLDSQLTLSKLQSLIIGLGFLIVLPLLLLATGFILWWIRRSR